MFSTNIRAKTLKRVDREECWKTDSKPELFVGMSEFEDTFIEYRFSGSRQTFQSEQERSIQDYSISWGIFRCVYDAALGTFESAWCCITCIYVNGEMSVSAEKMAAAQF